MTAQTVHDVATITRIDHAEAMELAAVENAKFAQQLRSFTTEDWGKPTDCDRWDVRAVAAHVVGSAAGQASPREFVRQVRGGKRFRIEMGSPFWWDGMNELQVHERAACTTDELVAEWDERSAQALRARRKLPRAIANLPVLNLPAPVGRQRVAYLFDVGFTRDVWAHRIDLAVATGLAFDADQAHDGRLLEDIVAEWAGTHGEPFTLEFTGPLHNVYQSGDDGEHVTIDAVEFVRTLAERTEGTGVLRHSLPL
jgi:uncharacterized protein (TIGR03083 family)